MKKEKDMVVSRIQALKEKTINLQTKLSTIEKSAAYASPETFEWYKNEIDKVLVDMEISIMGIEEAVERTQALADMGWFGGTEYDADYYVKKELSEGSRVIKKKISTLNELFDLAIN